MFTQTAFNFSSVVQRLVCRFFRASPAGVLSFFSLLGLKPLRSKRKKLSFCKRCAASVALRFFAVRARRQMGVSRFGFWL